MFVQISPDSVSAMPLGLAGRPSSLLPPKGSPGAKQPLQLGSMVLGSCLKDRQGESWVPYTLWTSGDAREIPQVAKPSAKEALSARKKVRRYSMKSSRTASEPQAPLLLALGPSQSPWPLEPSGPHLSSRDDVDEMLSKSLTL